jgi:hypothetical protein
MYLKTIFTSLLFLTVNGWGIDYGKRYGCSKPFENMDIMKGPTKIKDGIINFKATDLQNNVIDTFAQGENIILSFDSSSNYGIFVEVNHGTLSLVGKDSLSHGFGCGNRRTFTKRTGKTWIYNWVPTENKNLEIIFMFASGYKPSFMTYFYLNENSQTQSVLTTTQKLQTTHPVQISTTSDQITTFIPSVNTTSIPTSKNNDKSYNIILYKDLTLGWYIQDVEIYFFTQKGFQ